MEGRSSRHSSGPAAPTGNLKPEDIHERGLVTLAAFPVAACAAQSASSPRATPIVSGCVTASTAASMVALRSARSSFFLPRRSPSPATSPASTPLPPMVGAGSAGTAVPRSLAATRAPTRSSCISVRSTMWGSSRRPTNCGRSVASHGCRRFPVSCGATSGIGPGPSAANPNLAQFRLGSVAAWRSANAPPFAFLPRRTDRLLPHLSALRRRSPRGRPW